MDSFDIDEFLRHEVYLDRLASGAIRRNVDPAFRKLLEDLLAYIGVNGMPSNRSELTAFENAVARIVLDNDFTATVTDELLEAALYDLEWMGRQHDVTVQQVAQLDQFIGQQLMNFYSSTRTQAFYWQEFVDKYNDDLATSINNVLRTSFTRGETFSEVRKTLKEQLSRKSLNKSKAEMLVRTGFVHYTQQGRRALQARHPEQLAEAEFVAVWDNRTSLICRAHNGQRFDAEDKELPIPPLHPHCRSTLIYGPKGFDIAGKRGAVGAKGGQTLDNDTSHEAWLRRQPRWFIEDALGKERARLFIEQKYSLTRFVDMTSAQPLTLEQLRARNG